MESGRVKPYRRRGARVPRRLTIFLRWNDPHGDFHEEPGETVLLSRHGGSCRCQARLKAGEEVLLWWPGGEREARARIVFCQIGGTEGATVVAFEFGGAENFWEIDFPPRQHPLGGSLRPTQPTSCPRSGGAAVLQAKSACHGLPEGKLRVSREAAGLAGTELRSLAGHSLALGATPLRPRSSPDVQGQSLKACRRASILITPFCLTAWPSHGPTLALAPGRPRPSDMSAAAS